MVNQILRQWPWNGYDTNRWRWLGMKKANPICIEKCYDSWKKNSQNKENGVVVGGGGEVTWNNFRSKWIYTLNCGNCAWWKKASVWVIINKILDTCMLANICYTIKCFKARYCISTIKNVKTMQRSGKSHNEICGNHSNLELKTLRYTCRNFFIAIIL